ncbi:unnamed protein product [Heterobilharzia americana]|nr:unnamed protein product [Heterobilharzia americana]
MHSLHYSVKPCQNKPLQKKFDLRYQNIHRRALFEMKPIVDTTAPKTFQLIHLNSKKHRIEKENLCRIEEENNRLLKRMHEIHRTDVSDYQNHYIAKSLNARQRLKEVKRITRDNKELANRLKNCKNMYNHKKLEEDWLNTLTYMSNISKTGITYQKSISK